MKNRHDDNNCEHPRADRADVDEHIARLLDTPMCVEEWRAVADAAQVDATVWSRIGRALADDRDLRSLCDDFADRASHITLPDIERSRSPAGAVHRPVTAIARWSGWPVAAVLAIALVLAISRNDLPQSEPMVISPVSESREAMTADEALTAYIDAARTERLLIDELPLLAIDTLPAPDGNGMEVLYMRRFIERVHVDGERMFKLASDEHGRPVPIRADPAPQRRNAL